MSQSVLITGVAGFIGSNLLDYLIHQTDWHITGIDNLSTGNEGNVAHHLSNPRFVFIEQKCSDIKSLKPFQTVFHLAALPRIQPSFEMINEHIVANLLESTHLLELMIRDEHYPKFVYSGSSAIYGNPLEFPTTEKEGVNCLSPYAFQKYEVEKYLQLISTRYPLNYVTLRYFNPYGPRSFNPSNKFNAYSSVVGIFLYQAANKEELTITGDGMQERDFIHVSDVAYANYMAALSPDYTNDAFNVGAGTTIKILDLAKMISDRYVFIPKREGEADITWAEVSKTRSVLNWEPRHRINEFIHSEISGSDNNP
jgi:UDP-glucose 4-epimerase